MERSDAAALARAEDHDVWTLRWAQNTNDYQPDNETENAEDMFESALYPCFGEEGDREAYGIQLIDARENTGVLRGRLVDAAINPHTVTGWIQRCQLLHGASCALPGLDTRVLPDAVLQDFLVVDVINLCLCTLPIDARYVALSYVWGPSNKPVTIETNIAAFRGVNGLNVELPQTVRDAIDFTRDLGLRFIWIDSLCICQDRFDTKMTLINLMDAIYANALVTLVAATGSGAHSGLSGWSSNQNRTQQCVELADGLRLGVLPYYQQELLECDHASRAWTYQETCLSPRCLVFLNGFIYFNCNAAVYSEHVRAEIEGLVPEASANTLGKTEDEWATALEKFAQHVRSYASRSLTYQSDIAAAFAGISAALSTSTNSESIFLGMPTCCFDWTLLWSGRGSLRRRPAFPSWSWMGWEGLIEMSPTTNGDYDQMWLLCGTWVEWHLQRNDTCRLLWSQDEANAPVQRRLQAIVDRVAGQQLSNSSDILSTNSGEIVTVVDQVHGNDDDDPSSGGQDWCPTYGKPTMDNPFGRIIKPDSAVGALVRGARPHHQRISPCDGEEDSLLCFVAPVITLLAGPIIHLPPPQDVYPISELRDQDGRLCGLLSITDSDSWSLEASPKTTKLLLLSITSFASLSMFHAAGHIQSIFKAFGAENSMSEYIEGNLPVSLDNFDFFNVMLVQETSRKADIEQVDGSSSRVVVYERAGLGFVYRMALPAVECVDWESILLA